jgi:hypothetical protein
MMKSLEKLARDQMISEEDAMRYADGLEVGEGVRENDVNKSNESSFENGMNDRSYVTTSSVEGHEDAIWREAEEEEFNDMQDNNSDEIERHVQENAKSSTKRQRHS